MKSRIEQLLLRQDFDYLQPYFYNHPYALRCELGSGETHEAYMAEARRRADAIRHILFPHGADAMIFSYWITDWSDTGEAEALQYSDPEDVLAARVERQTHAFRFAAEAMMYYRHAAVKGLKTYLEPDDPDFDSMRRSRILCYADARGFDEPALIEQQLTLDTDLEIGLVSFENECILSVYDDRGCDVVFAVPEKLRTFYPLLQPYLLDYDRAEMERRFRGE